MYGTTQVTTAAGRTTAAVRRSGAMRVSDLVLGRKVVQLLWRCLN